MATPEQVSLFSDADVEFANKLIRADERRKLGISCDLERPTWAENNNIGDIEYDWCVQPFWKRMLAKVKKSDRCALWAASGFWGYVIAKVKRR